MSQVVESMQFLTKISYLGTQSIYRLNSVYTNTSLYYTSHKLFYNMSEM